MRQQPPQPPEPASAEAEVPDPAPVKKDVVEKIAVEDAEEPGLTFAEKVDTPSKVKQVAEVPRTIKTTETQSATGN